MKRREPRQRQRYHLDRQLAPAGRDPYQASRKPAGPAVCPECGAVFQRGRWRWGARPAQARSQICPACLRLRERQPAGFVTLSGDYLASHRREILALLRDEEARERPDHPLQRIMGIRERGGGIEVTTTDVHLARRMGDALRRAHHGELSVKYAPGEHLVRVRWAR